MTPVHLSAQPVIPSKGQVRVVGRPHPLRSEAFEFSVPAGQSLADLLLGVNTKAIDVRVDGKPVSDLAFLPPPGSNVEVVTRLQGTGQATSTTDATGAYTSRVAYDSKLQTATIVHTIGTAALTFIPYVGAFLAAIAGPVGSLVIGSLIRLAPLKQPPAPRKFYGIEGAKNETRPYGAVITVLGTCRVVPPLLTDVLSTWYGRQITWTAMLVDWGVGNLVLNDMMVGSTPAELYAGAARILTGTTPSWGLGDIDVKNPAVPLAFDIPGGGSLTSYTQDHCDRIMCEVVWNQTFYIQHDAANPQISRGHTDLRVRYRVIPPDTLLDGAINSSVTSIPLLDGSGWPTTFPHTISIGTEQMSVTNRVGNVLTVTRGFSGSTAAAHSLGDAVHAVGPGPWLNVFDLPVKFSGQDTPPDTTLNGAITNSATSVTVLDASAWPMTFPHVLQIGTEQILMTARSGNVLTVTRGYNSTTAVAHVTASPVIIFGGQAWDSPADPDPQPGNVSVFGIPASGSVRATFTEKTFNFYGSNSPTEPIVITIVWAPVVRTKYEVRVERYTEVQPPGAFNPVWKYVENSPAYWSKLVSTDTTKLPAYLDTTKTSLLFRANKDLSTIESLSALVSQIIPTWDSGTSSWIDAASSNPAFIFRWLLTACPSTLKQVPLSRIDDAGLIEWAAFCDAKGFVFNEVVDSQGTLYDLLTKIAAAGRGTLAIRDGKYSVVFDEAQTTPVQMFTPRNSKGFSGTRSFAPTVHGITCRFPNGAAGYQTDIRTVYTPGYNKDGSDGNIMADPKKLQDMDFAGVTSADSIWRLAMYHLAVTETRQNLYSFTTGVENLVCQRGDRIRVANDVTDWGAGWGRVTDALNLFMAYSITLAAGGTNIFPGSSTGISAGFTYGCRFTLGTACRVVGLRCEIAGAGTYMFSVWGPSTTPLIQFNAAPGAGTKTVYFLTSSGVPGTLDLDAGEYCVSIYSATLGMKGDVGNTSHAVNRQVGPLYIGNDAGVSVAGNANPLSGTGYSKGFRIEPIVLADISGIPGDFETSGAGILQEFTLDESPVVPSLGVGTYTVKIRNGIDPSLSSVNTAAIPENVARAVATFSRASPTGSYLDVNGALQYTNINDTQRYTYDRDGNFVGLLRENAATNYCLNSDDLSSASWIINQVSVQPNQKVWPNQVGSADRVFSTESTGVHALECNAVTVANNDDVGGSIFLHSGSATLVRVGVKRRDGGITFVPVDLSNGSIPTAGAGVSITDEGSYALTDQSGAPIFEETLYPLPRDIKVENYGNGWWRVSMVVNVGTGSGSTSLVLRILDATGTDNYSGQGESVYAVGCMIEKQPAVSTYLPAGGVTNTRAGEVLSFNIPTKFGRRGGLNQVRGSIILEIDNHSLQNSSDGPLFLLQLGSFSSPTCSLYAEGGFWQFGLPYVSFTAEGPEVTRERLRFVLTWQPNDDNSATLLSMSVNGSPCAIYLLDPGDGTVLGLSDSEILPAMGSGFASMAVNKLFLYDTAFTTAESQRYSVLFSPVPKENSYWVGGQDVSTKNAAVGDLAMLGTPSQEVADLMVMQIAPGPDLSATLTCCDYVDSVYSADSDTPPTFFSTLSGISAFPNLKVEPPTFSQFFDINQRDTIQRGVGGTFHHQFIDGTFGIEPCNNSSKVSYLEVRIRTARSDRSTWHRTYAFPALYPGAIDLNNAGLFADCTSPITDWVDDFSIYPGAQNAMGLTDAPPFIEDAVTGRMDYNQDVVYKVNDVASVGNFKAAGADGPNTDFTTFFVFARYKLKDGTSTLWAGMWADAGSSFGTRHLFDATTLLPSRYTSTVSLASFTATPNVNGIQLVARVNFTGFGLHYQAILTIERAPNVPVGGVDGPGTWVVLDTLMSDDYSNIAAIPVAQGSDFQYQDPKTDGSTWWYRVTATMSFNTTTPAVSSQLKAKAMQVTDGADVTGHAVMIPVKNPEFEEGDISWIKGTGWSIIRYP